MAAKTDGKALQKEAAKWIDRIEAAAKAEKTWLDEAAEAVCAYTGEGDKSDTGSSAVKYDFNILFSNVETIVPAIINSPPAPDIRRRFDTRDEAARQFCGLAFGDIAVRDEAFHTTLSGKRLWITHGDLFDGVIQHAKWLAYLGDSLYTLTLLLNRWFNRVRTRFGFPYWSLSQYLKHQVKNAVNFISAFEQVMADEARRRGCDGVVCGHIHKPEIREIDGLLYCNDGDWVESLSALVETAEGELRIVHWTHKRATRAPAKVTPVSA